MTDDKCRICLNSVAEMFDIFFGDKKVMLSTKIMFVAKIQVCPGDGLPTMICSKCLTMLNSCLDFINLCQVNDLKQRASIKINIEDKNLNDRKKQTTDLESSLKIEQSYTGTEIIEIPEENVKKIKQKNINTRKKIQQCSVCGRVMSSTYRLKTHLATHTGERPFNCSDCGKGFSLPETLKVHLRIHTGEKPHRCLICGESFTQSSGLIAHRRKHSGQLPYKCKLCPRSFRTIGHYQYHTKRHTGEKKFECDTCGRGFITRGDLKQHIATHSGDRPHVCSVCGLRLSRASNLKRHIQKLHNLEYNIYSISKPCEIDESIAKVKINETIETYLTEYL